MDRLDIGGRRIELARGDITGQEVDAIANAANAALRGGGGVVGAIHRAAGPELMQELRRRYPSGTPTGTAVATGAYRLPARWVLHAVGPVYRDGAHGEAEQLASAYRACLRLADELGARSVAFPAISMGIYGYPPSEGAQVALETVAEHLRGDTGVELARFVLYSEDTFRLFADRLAELARTAG
ncbi:MAG TPA: O-acetyl-ADP-ribose deacetylase [Candidatus Limnocylindria bacterium]|nr:O-acetyl-ADP-ribose deacetylase [Candidatus Limnocylindria bacterium]